MGQEQAELYENPERDAAAWKQRLKELEEEQRSYLRPAAQ